MKLLPKYRTILIKKQTQQFVNKHVPTVSLILRGVFKPPGTVDNNPSERKLHFFIRGDSPIEVSKCFNLLQSISSTGHLSANCLQQSGPGPVSIAGNYIGNISGPMYSLPYFPSATAIAPSQQILSQYQGASRQFQTQSIQPMVPMNPLQKMKVPLGALAFMQHPQINLRSKVLGPQGQYIKHISLTTGAR